MDLYQKRMLNEFPCIFKVVENFHTNGDSYVREAATIRFLESLQNHSSHVELDPEVFDCYLHPASLRWWDALNRFWSGKIPYVCIED